MNKNLTSLIFVAVVLSITILVYALNGAKEIELYSSIARLPKISPDYSDMVIPANIAPLNFLVQEKGSDYRVKIYSEQGRPIEIVSKSPKIIIPQTQWRELLNENKGQQIYFDVFVETEGQWNRFSAITNKIADEQIDGYLAYRKIHPGHSTWRNMGIYQRNLQNYDESTILNNRTDMSTCLNCHAFRNNHTDKMTLGVRSSEYGSSALLAVDGEVVKIGTKFGYTSWHPTGRLVLYSVSKTNQFYHSAGNEIRDVIDMDSMLAYYSLGSKTVKTTPELSG